MRCALFAPITFTDEHFGQMVETAIIAQWLHRGDVPLHFAAWPGGEVDLVMVAKTQKPQFMIEIKWSNQYVRLPHKLKSLLKYAKENKKKSAWVTTIDKVDHQVYDEIHLCYLPAASYCFSVGKYSFLFSREDNNGQFFNIK